MGKIYGKQNKEVKTCPNCSGPAKVYDPRSRHWWCPSCWLELLKDYRSADEV
jgi:transposase